MNSQLIIDLIRQQLLPAIGHQDFRFLPTTDAVVHNSNYYQSVFPYALHSHSFFEWVWCVENQAFLNIHNTVYRLEAGDFCLLRPGDMHADVFIPSITNYKVLWNSYHQEVISSHLHECTLDGRFPCLSLIRSAAPPFTAPLLSALQYELQMEQTNYQAICASLVQTLAQLMLRAFEKPLQPVGLGNSLSKITILINEYIEEHFREPLSLMDIANALHFNQNYLATMYKKETGNTIGQTLKEVRLTHAKRLLVETDLSVREISKSVGYASPGHFSRVFQEQEGVQPRRYGK